LRCNKQVKTFNASYISGMTLEDDLKWPKAHRMEGCKTLEYLTVVTYTGYNTTEMNSNIKVV
jgi:hypothetical protein